VTAGNTQTPIDQVRCITNIFTGKTGARIAVAAVDRRHDVRLLTSHPEGADATLADAGGPRPAIETSSTYNHLRGQLETHVQEGGFDAIVHAAAVSDYAVAGVYAPQAGSAFDAATLSWPAGAKLANATGAKISGSLPELWLRLAPVPKLI